MLNMHIWYLKIVILHSTALAIYFKFHFPKVIVYFEQLRKAYSLLFRYWWYFTFFNILRVPFLFR